MDLIVRLVVRGLIAASRTWSREFRTLVEDLGTTPRLTVSIHLINSLVEAEDHRFWTHPGVDVRAVARAIFRFVLRRKLEGASTIQQQLVRVVTGRYEITLRRKIREMAFAVALGDFLAKDDMLVLYLVRGHYGWGMSGLPRACTRLGINPRMANPVQAASLVARLRYPEPRSYSLTQYARIERRIQHILNRLAFAKHRDLTIGCSRPRNLLRSALGG